MGAIAVETNPFAPVPTGIPVDHDPFNTAGQPDVGDTVTGSVVPVDPAAVEQTAPPSEGPAPQEASQASIPWSQVIAGAIQNTPDSGIKAGNDLLQMVMHPIVTAETLLDAAIGFGSLMLPETRWKLPQEEVAKKLADHFKKRYDGPEALKATIQKDPVGFLMDLGGVLSLGGGTIAKAGTLAKAGAVTKTGKVIATAGRAIDPSTVVGKGVSFSAKGAGHLIAAGSGLATGTGKTPITTVFNAADEGGQKLADAKQGVRGDGSESAMLIDAQDSLAALRAKKRAEYKAGETMFRGDRTHIDFDPVDAAFDELFQSSLQGNQWRVGKASQAKLQEIADVIDEFKGDPSARTAADFDALKQRLDDLMPTSLQGEAPTMRRMVTEIRNAVKDIIVDKVPSYKETMRQYEAAIALEKDIAAELGVGSNQKAGGILRKLLSATRDNVNTNFGQRAKLVDELDAVGGKNLKEKLSGFALNKLTAQGMAGIALVGNAAANIYAGFDPLFAATLLVQSPRVAGEVALAAGTAKRGLRKAGVTPRSTVQAGVQTGKAISDDDVVEAQARFGRLAKSAAFRVWLEQSEGKTGKARAEHIRNLRSVSRRNPKLKKDIAALVRSINRSN